MPGIEECLFSLELVVEKLYIPHIICRFPSVAFRLLDFPTIVISHVEDDLGKAIRRNISLDSDYAIPEQFAELKDKHGNFMIKKGKSCLFKMAAETLKNHLSSTPLYVMVIDMFPETPTLVGNSTVPLNVVMSAIFADLIRLGSSVPSVHGDKGLFKIYNLMGKELGYFVLGFRLLCLGSTLIPHLPEGTVVPRLNKKQTQLKKLKNEQIVEMIQLSQGDAREDDSGDELVEMKTTGSMTDVVKKDALIQTVELADRAVHVQIQETSVFPAPVDTLFPAAKVVKDCTTQTEKKTIKTVFNAKKKILEDLAAMQEDDDKDEVFVTNIICPPPLFYNSEAMPPVEVNNDSCSLHTDISSSDKLTIESLTDEELETGDMPARKEFDQEEHIYQSMGKIMPPPAPISYQDIPLNLGFNKEQRRRNPRQVSNKGQSHKVPLQSGAGFPLLNALMNELLCIQNPTMLQNIPFQMPPHMFASTLNSVPGAPQLSHPEGLHGVLRMDEAHNVTSRAQREDAALNTGGLKEKSDGGESKNISGRQEQKSHAKCTHPHPGVPREKSWLRSVPEHSMKKSKLTFGLTNTQRLRLKKTNPAWLMAMEGMEGATSTRRSRKQLSPSKQYSKDDFNTTSLSDTLTEVRRQAQKELEQTSAADTLGSSFSLPPTALSTQKKEAKKSKDRPSPKKQTPSQRKAVTGSPKGQKIDQHIHPSKKNSACEKQSDKTASSADRDKNQTAGDSNEHLMTTASDVRSSGRSIEVHIPFVHHDAVHDDASESSISDSDGESDIPLPDGSYRGDRRMPSKFGFPDYLKRDRSLPDSITGQPNCSLNTTSEVDENSPLESTRNSKHYSSEYKNSKTMRSTDDYDAKQFPSGSEPELQGLVTDDEEEGERYKQQNVANRFPIINPMLSQQSPVPSMRQSVVKLDLNKSHIPPTPKKDDITSLSSRSESPKRPTPRPRRPPKDLRDSAHTDSISSYMPSDPDNVVVSISSGDGNYSDDFQDLTALSKLSSEKPRIIPSTQLGYTIY